MPNATFQILIQVLLIIFLKFEFMKRVIFINIVVLLNCLIACSQNSEKQSNNLSPDSYRDKQSNNEKVIPGAERTNVYLPFLKGKRVGIFANHTSMVGNTHLVDTLKKL